jgi:hypothetical protein
MYHPFTTSSLMRNLSRARLYINDKDGLKLKKLALKSIAVVTIALGASMGVAQSANAAVPNGSFKCIPKTQEFHDIYQNHHRYEYIGAVYSAGHGYYKYHHWLYPFDKGIVSCKAG